MSDASTLLRAPVLWTFATGRNTLGLFVDEQHCWVANEGGRIFCLDHEANLQSQHQLPKGVKGLVADGDWIYAGCNDGRVYDLTGTVPRVAYELAGSTNIFWLDIHDGVLGVSDGLGNVLIVNHEDENQWSRKSEGRSGWMIRCDEIGVYHGHSGGVTMYDWEDGAVLWHQPTQGGVLFGWQEEAFLYAGTSQGFVHVFQKNGAVGPVCRCDAPIFSCSATPGGKYILAADNKAAIYCFDEAGSRLWKLDSGCGSAFTMQFFQDRLYLTTTQGLLACMDASEAALLEAGKGVLPTRRDVGGPVEAPAPVALGMLETVREASGGEAVVECVQVGDRLRIRPVSEGYHKDWNVQFPKDIRVPGARYVVESLRAADKGGFYRAFGTIRRLT